MIISWPEDTGATLIDNLFIDYYMAKANGEFVKIYLYLVRCADAGCDITVPSIADFFQQTEGDVRRALHYWELSGLIYLVPNKKGEVEEIQLLPPRRPETADQASAFGAPVQFGMPASSALLDAGVSVAPEAGAAVEYGSRVSVAPEAGAAVKYGSRASVTPEAGAAVEYGSRASVTPEAGNSGKAARAGSRASVTPEAGNSGKAARAGSRASAAPEAGNSGKAARAGSRASVAPEAGNSGKAAKAGSGLPAVPKADNTAEYEKETSAVPITSKAAKAARAGKETSSVPESAVPAEEAGSRQRDRQLQRAELSRLFYVAETYFQRKLSSSEMSMLDYFVSDLGMSPDLVEYLLEYCIGKGHTSVRYMEKVAQAWALKKITSVSEAKDEARSFGGDYTAIFRELGLTRQPAPAEMKLMDKWLSEYSYSLDIIKEACRRTILQASQPSLSYADGILSSWHSSGARNMDQIRKLDEEHAADARTRESASEKPKAGQSRGQKSRLGASGRFSGYSHEDTDWNSISRAIMDQQKQET